MNWENFKLVELGINFKKVKALYFKDIIFYQKII